jgi:hypothetical protein
MSRSQGARGHRPWTTIKYPNAIFAEDQQRRISDAQVAEIGYTALGSLRRDQQVAVRLIVRRVPDLNSASQSEPFNRLPPSLSPSQDH